MRKVESIRELRKICFKEYSFIEMPLPSMAIYLTKLFLYTGITANQVTLLNVLVGLSSGVFLIFGHSWSMLVGALVWYLYGVLDFTDGQIARYRGTAGLTGAYLDRLCHQIVDPYIFIAIAFGLYSAFHNVVIFAFGFLSGISMLLYRLASYNTYIGAVEARLHYLETGAQSKEAIEIDDPNTKEIIPHRTLASRLPVVYAVASFMPGYGMILMFLVAALIDLVAGPWTIGSLEFNSIYLYLFLWGVLAPTPCLVFAWIAVRTRSTERLYTKLFGRL